MKHLSCRRELDWPGHSSSADQPTVIQVEDHHDWLWPEGVCGRLWSVQGETKLIAMSKAMSPKFSQWYLWALNKAASINMLWWWSYRHIYTGFNEEDVCVCDLIDVDQKLWFHWWQVGPGEGYVLTVGGFNDALSTLGDSMYYSNGMKFSTK